MTGIAKSKWVMYGPFFVEVLARAAAHFRGQQAGSISMEEELFIDYNTLPGGWGDWCVWGGLFIDYNTLPGGWGWKKG